MKNVYETLGRLPYGERILISILMSLLFLLILFTPFQLFANIQSGTLASATIADESKTFIPNPILTLNAQPLALSPVIDGEIEESWLQSAHFNNFAENYPNERQKPKALTEGYITHDDKNLYIAFICYDPDMKQLRAVLSDRDALYEDDFIGLNIDPFGAQLNGFEFFVNPLGVQADLSVDVTGNEDDSFDAVWESAAKIYDDRWTAEIKIPFKSLRFPNKPEQDWLIHFYRIYPRESRYVYSWMATSRDISNQYAQAGHLKMKIPETSSSRNIEFLPYTVGTSEKSLIEKDNGEGKWDKRQYDGDVGFNLKYGLTSNVTLDVAYNPDFSQIESDAGQISANNPFALFYNEKRPFFLEGRDIFYIDSDINLLYTRTIGDPLVVGKISGKAGKLSFGYISGYDESTQYVIPFEESGPDIATNKNSMSNILRTKYELNTGTYIGFTGTDRRLSHASNSVGTIDAKVRLNSKYTLSALASLSHTNESNDSLLTDENIGFESFKEGHALYTGDFDGENFDGHLLRLTLDRTAKHWGFFAWYNDRSPGFRSENGFINSNNLREVGSYQRYTFYYPQSTVLDRVEPRLQFNRKYNYDGKLKDWWINPQLFIQFKQQTYVWMSVAALNNENFRGRQFNHIHRFAFEFGTKVYKNLYGGIWTENGNYINRSGNIDDQGIDDPRNPLAKAKGFNFQTWITVKPTSQLSNQIDYRQFNLWTHYGGSLITAQKILRNTLAYQFTRRLFLRIIGEYTVSESNESATDDDGNFIVEGSGKYQRDHSKSKFYSVDPLISYKINPFTVFFLGAHFGGEKDPFPNYNGLTQTQQSVFVKFQYFMRI